MCNNIGMDVTMTLTTAPVKNLREIAALIPAEDNS
jgi:hypothetical protein